MAQARPRKFPARSRKVELENEDGNVFYDVEDLTRNDIATRLRHFSFGQL
jgi:hypothetical protein